MTHVKFSNRLTRNPFNSFVEDVFADLPGFLKNDPAVTNWKADVPVNITETEKGFRLEVIAPGYEKTDIKISLEQNLLTVSAEKKPETPEIEKRIRREFNFPGFKRTFTIDETVDATKTEARFINGVLILNLPKKEEVKGTTKEIEIS